MSLIPEHIIIEEVTKELKRSIHGIILRDMMIYRINFMYESLGDQYNEITKVLKKMHKKGDIILDSFGRVITRPTLRRLWCNRLRTKKLL